MAHATKNLTVTLDTNDTPPVTVVEGNLSVGKHDYIIVWKPAAGQSGWTFKKITQADQESALTNPPFTSVTVTPGQITVEDDNKHKVDHGTWSYSICVTAGGQDYWSDPEIINKGGD